MNLTSMYGLIVNYVLVLRQININLCYFKALINMCFVSGDGDDREDGENSPRGQRRRGGNNQRRRNRRKPRSESDGDDRKDRFMTIL